MKTHHILCGVVAAILLAACASPGAQTGRSKTCPGNSCDVEVQVTMVGGAPTVVIDFDEIRFPKGNQNSTITWKDSVTFQNFQKSELINRRMLFNSGRRWTSRFFASIPKLRRLDCLRGLLVKMNQSSTPRSIHPKPVAEWPHWENLRTSV